MSKIDKPTTAPGGTAPATGRSAPDTASPADGDDADFGEKGEAVADDQAGLSEDEKLDAAVRTLADEKA